jgi:hypothetical protein
MITESAPMKPREMAPGTYVCVRDCQHSPHITIRSDGVWVRSPDPDPLNPGSHLYSSAHRDCYEAWAASQDAIREAGTRTDARALAAYMEARTPVDPELFRRTAPAWNCIAYPDGMHYLPGTSTCAWCGMTRAEITRQLDKQEN